MMPAQRAEGWFPRGNLGLLLPGAGGVDTGWTKCHTVTTPGPSVACWALSPGVWLPGLLFQLCSAP